MRAGLSQRELSRRLDKPITYAGKVEARERRIDPVEMGEWATACGVPTPEVLRAIGLAGK
jgi:hypothetical protein